MIALLLVAAMTVSAAEQRVSCAVPKAQECTVSAAIFLTPAYFGTEGPDCACAYPLDGMVPLQRVSGGYLIIPDPERFPGYSHPAYLKTKKHLERGQQLAGWWARSYGVYSYQALDGMDSATYAFEEVSKKP